MGGSSCRHRRSSRDKARRHLLAAGFSTVGAFLALGATSMANAPGANADFLDPLFDLFDFADVAGGAGDVAGQGVFDLGADSVNQALATAVDTGSSPGIDLADPAAAFDVDGLLEQFYATVHTGIDNWLDTSAGENFADWINQFAPQGEIFLGDGADGTVDHPDGFDGGLWFGDGGDGYSGWAGAAQEHWLAGDGGNAGNFGDGGDGGAGGVDVHGGAGGNGGSAFGNGGDGGAGGSDTIGGIGGLGGDVYGDHGASDYGDTEAGTIPIRMDGDDSNQPVVDVSIGGGKEIPVIVDTGSAGLTIPIGDLANGWANADWTSLNVGSFAGMAYLYVNVPTTIDYGHDAVADDVMAKAILFSFPLSLSDSQATGGVTADGILGIGPNAVGGPADTITSFGTDDFNDGVLINEPGGLLQFGPKPENLGDYDPITVPGAPFTDGHVSIDGGAAQDATLVFDTGGKGGTIAESLAGDAAQPLQGLGGNFLFGLGFGWLPAGSEISVTDANGDVLYTYVTDAPMTVLPDGYAPAGLDNPMIVTGNTPFADTPVYLSNDPAGEGAMTFYR